MDSMRSRTSYLRRIRVCGRGLEIPLEIKDEVARFFEDLYRSENVIRPMLDGVSFPSISSDMQSWLKGSSRRRRK